jgi:hypothetical protein
MNRRRDMWRILIYEKRHIEGEREEVEKEKEEAETGRRG